MDKDKSDLKKCIFLGSQPGAGFSGQAAATELIIEGFADRGVDIERLSVPKLERDSRAGRLFMGVRYLWQCCLFFGGIILLPLKAPYALHVNLSQTRSGLFRHALAVKFGALWPNYKRCAVALHGSLFLDWGMDSLEAKMFRWIIRSANHVSCLGKIQKAKLEDLGIEKTKIVEIPNICEFEGIGAKEVIEKQTLGSSDAIRVLFLGSLIESKGYANYVEALAALEMDGGRKVSATLCGPITLSPYDERFSNHEEIECWIEERSAVINAKEGFKFDWVRGARGEEKKRLFDEAHVFVFPTFYPVEAQPLVVIEAMARGCAVVSTNVGELPTTIDEGCAIIVDGRNVNQIVEVIERLRSDDELRLRLATESYARFEEQFSRSSYIDDWWSALMGNGKG